MEDEEVTYDSVDTPRRTKTLIFHPFFSKASKIGSEQPLAAIIVTIRSLGSAP